MPLFVPITDALVYDYPEQITTPLIPFSLDYDCYRWMADELSAVHREEENGQQQPEE